MRRAKSRAFRAERIAGGCRELQVGSGWLDTGCRHPLCPRGRRVGWTWRGGQTSPLTGRREYTWQDVTGTIRGGREREREGGRRRRKLCNAAEGKHGSFPTWNINVLVILSCDDLRSPLTCGILDTIQVSASWERGCGQVFAHDYVRIRFCNLERNNKFFHPFTVTLAIKKIVLFWEAFESFWRIGNWKIELKHSPPSDTPGLLI